MVKCISATKCILHPRAHVEKKLINDWLEEVTTEAPSPVFCRFWSSYVSKRGIFLGDFLMYNQKRNVLLTHYIHCISWGSATQFGPNLAFEKRFESQVCWRQLLSGASLLFTEWSRGFFFQSCIKLRQRTCSNCLLPFSFTLLRQSQKPAASVISHWPCMVPGQELLLLWNSSAHGTKGST